MRKLLLFLIMFFACSQAFAGASPVVTSIELSNKSVNKDEEILRIFSPRVGEPYDSEKIIKSIGYLSKLPGVLNARVSKRDSGQGVALKVEIFTEPLISILWFEGTRLFKGDDLAFEMLTHVDGPLYIPHVERDLEKIRQKYVAEGYLDAKLTYAVDKGATSGFAVLNIRVDEGKPHVVTELGDLGDAPKIGVDKVTAKLGMGLGDPAGITRLRVGQKALKEWLWSEGYPEARINGAKLEVVPSGFRLDLPVTLGRKVKIDLVGADGLGESSLVSLIAENYGETIDEEWCKKVSLAIAEELNDQGYYSPEVKTELIEVPGLLTLRVIIAKGQKVYLKKVIFSGNEHIGSGELLDLMESNQSSFLSSPLFVRKTLDVDLDRLGRYYASKGYLFAKAELKEIAINPEGGAVLTIAIEEGRLFHFGRISYEVTGDIDPKTVYGWASLNSGQVVDPVALDRAKVRLLTEASKAGYMDAEVAIIPTMKEAEGILDVVLSANMGSPRKVGKIVLTGNTRTQPAVILRQLSIKAGGPWNSEEIVLSKHKLTKLGYFQQVKIDPAPAGSDVATRDIIVSVKEQDSGWVEFGGGYATAEGLIGFAEVGHSNIYGAGRILSFRIDVDGLGQTYSVNYLEPWVFGIPLDLRFSLLNQNEEAISFNLNATALQTSLTYQAGRYLSVSAMHTFADNLLENVDQQAIISHYDEGAYIESVIGPTIIWDSRNDPFNPQKGYYHSLQAQYASPVFGSQPSYDRYLASFSGYGTAYGTTLALLARGGYSNFTDSSGDLPINHRFYLGGRTTVRGFARDSIGPMTPGKKPIGGDTMINLKAEIRFPLYKDLGGALFWDAGQVWLREVQTPAISDLRKAAGFGFRYNTPVGPISFDMGFKLDRKKGESGNEWHFTIGNVF